EFSGIGQGDYRTSPCEIRIPHVGYDLDLVHTGHAIHAGTLSARTLPTAHGSPSEATTLVVDLVDERAGIAVALHYTVFAAADVITRRVVVRNTGAAEVVVEKLLSFQLDLPEATLGDAPRLITLDGAWIAETHAHDRPIGPGFSGVSSSTGSSSNRHNPGFLLAATDAGEDPGRVHGFNLVYTGNHHASVERGATGLLRVAGGINPQGFSWPLSPDEEFETPEAVLAFADTGF